MIWSVIPTRNRPAQLCELLTDIDPKMTVIVDTGENPWVKDLGCTRVPVPREPPNISRWWNIGLQVVMDLAGPCDVAVLNDDVRVPAGTLEALQAARQHHKAAVAFPDVHRTLIPGSIRLRDRAAPHNLFFRMTGYCFVIDGALGLRADESLAWWYGDDDLEWRASEVGGVLQVGGTTVHHEDLGGLAPDLLAQVGRDRERFIEKWGQPPW